MYAENKGVKIWYETHGIGEPTLIMVPGFQIVHSEGFKRSYVPHLSRHMRVVTLDLRGNGKSDRPNDGYNLENYVADVHAVVKAAGLDRFSLAGLSLGTPIIIKYQATHPERVSSLVMLSGFADRIQSENYPCGRPVEISDAFIQGWKKDPESMLTGFIEMVCTEAYSLQTKEHLWKWAHETRPEIWGICAEASIHSDVKDDLKNVKIPALIVNGRDDRLIAPEEVEYLHTHLQDSHLEFIPNAGHGFIRSWPLVSLKILQFLKPKKMTPASPAKKKREPRVLWISSPIGLGHVKRDLAVAAEIRHEMPHADINWLAVNPVRSTLEGIGEKIHPLSSVLLEESSHFEKHGKAYSLNATEAYWDMDKVLNHNFMVFCDVVRESQYDLVIGDESWEVAEYLHYNPSLKTAPFVFITDFIGTTNVSDDKIKQDHVYNVNGTWVEMRKVSPETADLSIFVGEYDDIPEIPLGKGLPGRRKFAKDHFKPSGYILPFDPAAFSDRQGIRAELGILPEEKILIVAVGGTSVGRPLIETCLDAHKSLLGKIPGLRTQILCGPRIDPETFSHCQNAEFKPFISDPIKLFAASDLAIIQGGLSTAMELTALSRPFLYFPLIDHFEQQEFVTFRLNRYNAGIRMDFDSVNPEDLADAIAKNIGKSVEYQPVNTDGAKRAANLIIGVLDKGDA